MDLVLPEQAKNFDPAAQMILSRTTDEFFNRTAEAITIRAKFVACAEAAPADKWRHFPSNAWRAASSMRAATSFGCDS
jgi:hypothetical protein